MRTEEFPIDEKELERFIRANRGIWEDTRGEESRRPIYVNLSMVRLQVSWFLPKLLYARGMAEALGAGVRVLTWRKNPQLTRFLESFQIRHIAIDDLDLRAPLSGLKGILKTASALLSVPDGEALQKLRLSGIHVGESLYEDILRTSPLSTIRSARSPMILKKLLHLSWSFYALEGLLKKRGIAFGLMDDSAYHEGMFARLFMRYGAKTVSVNDWLERPITLREDGSFDRDAWNLREFMASRLTELTEKEEGEALELLTARFSGKNGRKIDTGAFSGRVVSRKELAEEMGLDPAKKNVVIMAHTFSDGVFNQGRLYFRDYYDWLEQTLILAGNNTEVNWILKPHPTRSAYNESEDSIEGLYRRYAKSNIHFFPDSVSAESVAQLADVLCTIGGNAGLEFACFGIPPVITGKPFYHGFGFTREPESRRAYEECLHNIAELPRLDREQTAKARRLFWVKNNLAKLSPAYFRDSFAEVNDRHYLEMIDAMALSYFDSNADTAPYNTKSLAEITEWMKTGDLRKTEYYLRGKAMASYLFQS